MPRGEPLGRIARVGVESVTELEAGYDTLAGVIEDLARRGFAANFGVVHSRLRALDSGKSFAAEELVIREYHRFEGASNPDDMSIVYAIETRSGMRGTLVDAFGVYSNPVVSEFLKDVPIQRRLKTAAEANV